MSEIETPSEFERWEGRYRENQIPWNTDKPSSELVRIIESGQVPTGKAIEFGSGYGTNAFYLEEKGFEVTGVDLSSSAVAEAQKRAKERSSNTIFLEADLLANPDLNGPYDFLFDRGTYHILRRVNLDAFLSLLDRITQPGSIYLSLTGNTNEPSEQGPPKVSEAEIRAEIGSLFNILELREFRWGESLQMSNRPLGWSVLMRREATE